MAHAFPFIFAIALPLIAVLAYDAQTRLMSRFVEHYGAWLALFGLVLSVSGLHFSALAMQDFRHIINTFEDFKTEFSSLLQGLGDKPNSTNYVRIVAYTPLPGALALTPTDYDALRDLILDKDSRVEITCLDEHSSKEWMERFCQKKTRGGQCLDQNIITKAVAEVEDLNTKR